MERIVKKEVHRLVVVDEENRVIGIVSLSDILTYIVLKQEEQQTSQDHTKTASLTTAFGLTRLSSSVDHVVLNENNTSAHKLLNQSINDNNSNDSRTSSPLTATTNQPQASSIDQAIFEDDPMETEPIK